MNVDVVGVCRGGTKVFFRLLVSDVEPESLVSLSAHANGKAIPLMVFEGDTCVPVTRASSARDFIVIVPQLRVNVDVSVDLVTPSAKPISRFEYTLKPFGAKWKSRLNRVFHPSIISSIRNCDLERTLGRAVITFRDCVLVNDASGKKAEDEECIYHGTAYVPCDLTSDDMTLACFDGLFEKVDARFTFSPIKRAEESSDKTAPLWELDFALRVPASLNGFTVVAVNKVGKPIVGFESISGRQIAGLRKNVGHYSVNAWNDSRYHRWLLSQRPSQSELEIQREHRFPSNPLFSFIVGSKCISAETLRETIGSILSQTYPFYEIVVALPCSGESGNQLGFGNDSGDSRIVIIDGADDASCMRDALAAAKGDFVAFVSSGDTLEPNMLFEYAKAVNDVPSTDALYCDEDYLLANGLFGMPFLKPAFSIDYLRSTDYIGHLLAVRAEIVQSVPIAYEQPDELREYDFALKVAECTRKIAHIGRVLCHRRAEDERAVGESPLMPDGSDWRTEAVKAHLDRLGIAADVTVAFPRCNRVAYHLVDNPLVSIIIPSKDSSEMLDRCITSIKEKTHYANYEIIVVENNSTETATFDYYERIQSDNMRIRVTTWQGEGFNYSSLVNFGVAHARGDYVLFLNNDTEIVSKKWIEYMLGYCQRDDVGVVGARLLFPDETIQHAGVIVTNGSIEHIGYRVPREDNGYMSIFNITRSVSAVTGACMMVSRESFEEAGGFDEILAVAYNDIDFCLKVRSLGKANVYVPFVELMHYESFSRGRDDSPEKRIRFMGEWAYFWHKWPEYYVKGDPSFNRNLNQTHERVGYFHLAE